MACLRAGPSAWSTQAMSTFSALSAASSTSILDGASFGIVRLMHGHVAMARNTFSIEMSAFGSASFRLSALAMWPMSSIAAFICASDGIGWPLGRV
eukprot:scaffold4703_cov117-Isochrysis_galbana.AAC.2